MRFISILLVLLCLSGCAGQTILEVGAGKNSSFGNATSRWNDQSSPGAYISLRRESDRFVCHYTHYSQWAVGKPFNDLPESSLDHIGCAVRFNIAGGRR